jgi:hypothetical protein
MYILNLRIQIMRTYSNLGGGGKYDFATQTNLFILNTPEKRIILVHLAMSLS